MSFQAGGFYTAVGQPDEEVLALRPQSVQHSPKILALRWIRIMLRASTRSTEIRWSSYCLVKLGPRQERVAGMKNGTLLHPEARAEILRRIEALTPRSERRWGRMTPHQMVCHLSDACRAALGERRVPVIGTLWERTVIRWLAIHTNVKWPQGVRTVPEADQEIGGTRPTEFARDVDELRGLIQRFSGPKAQLSGYHPLFGALSAAEWGRFSYRHADHHLRQFGA